MAIAATPRGSAAQLRDDGRAPLLSPKPGSEPKRPGRQLPCHGLVPTNSHSWWTEKRGPLKGSKRRSEGARENLASLVAIGDNLPVGTEFVTARFDEGARPFVFVLGGETEPMLDTGAPSPVSANGHPSTDDAPPAQALLLYEYWWTIATFDLPSTSGEWSARRHQEGHRIPLTHRATTPASPNEGNRLGFAGYTAQIEIYFPTERGWRVRDRAAAVRYLAPLPPDLREEVAKDWQDLTPILEGASEVAGAASSFAGPAAAETANSLAALAQVRANSVPQEGLPWWVTSIAASVGGELYEGVLWTLSETLLERLGGRVTGSVVVSVIPAFHQGAEDGLPSGQHTIHEGTLRARATLYRDGQQIPTPPPPEPLAELRVNPR